MATSQRRSSTLKITITPEIHERLRKLGEVLGQAPAALASFAVSQFVVQQEAQLGAANRAADSITAALTPAMQEQLSLLVNGGKK